MRPQDKEPAIVTAVRSFSSPAVLVQCSCKKVRGRSRPHAVLFQVPTRAGRPPAPYARISFPGSTGFPRSRISKWNFPAVGPPLSIVATTVPGSTLSPSLKSGATFRP